MHSLGKERGAGKLQRVATFYALLSRLHKEYDAVFVHMNPEYLVLAGLWWRLAGKRVGLWYNHTVGSLWLKVGQLFTHKVFHTSPFAYTARYGNAHRMPAGIDTNIFKPMPEIIKKPGSIYFQGRVSPAKRVHIILEAFDLLRQSGEEVTLTIAGPEDEAYVAPLKQKYAQYLEEGVLTFLGPQKHSETPKLFNEHTVSINLTDDGNYDKTVLESLACGTPAIVSSKAFADAPVISIEVPKAKYVAEALSHFFINQNQGKLVEYVEKEHGLEKLSRTLYEQYARN